MTITVYFKVAKLIQWHILEYNFHRFLLYLCRFLILSIVLLTKINSIQDQQRFFLHPKVNDYL